MVISIVDNNFLNNGFGVSVYPYYKKQNYFALIFNGKITSYSTYTRSGIGYNTDEIEVVENVQTSDLSENLLKYFHYAGSDEFLTIVSQPYLSIRAEDNDPNFAYKPFKSDLRTEYGIGGLFNGVDSNTAQGKVVIEKFKIKSIDEQVNLLLTNDNTPILWIEQTTGLIKATDGTNICTSNFGIIANQNYKIELVWYDSKFFIRLNGDKGNDETFSGTFPLIGEFLKYSDSSIYHTVRSIIFSNNVVQDLIIYDDLNNIITDEQGRPITI